jgi:hypothetical protein
MKKLLLVIFTLSIFGNVLFAQNADFKNTFSVHYGASIFSRVKGDITGNGSTAAADSTKYTSAGFSNIPTIGIAWDHGVRKWFSIGLAASYNQAKASVKDLEVRNNKGTYDKLGDFSITVPRTTLAARFLFHYGNKKRFDCYTGFRFGVGIWSVKTSANIDRDILRRAIDGIKEDLKAEGLEDIPYFNKVDNAIKTGGSFVLPQAQLILFGIRGYVTEHIGINGELAVGSPYVLSLGANYRF